jgi:hypothetical protein
MGYGVSPAVIVFCVACNTETQVHSRTEFSNFDDHHRVVCKTRALLHGATLDDLLDLPPHSTIDLTQYEPAWLTQSVG